MSSKEQKPYGWTAVVPVALAVGLALLPAPSGLAQHAWYFFAFFVGVVSALIIEPIPTTATGIVAITATAVLSRWILFSPDELAKPGFKIANEAVKWAFSGFSNPTCWLVGGAFMFALGYEKTGLGRRIALILVRKLGKNSLTLGYATTIADCLLAPFTPSNTARCAGTMFPVVVHLPPIYDSKPNDPSAHRIGSYIMWTTLAADCVTSSLFMTGCAPNFLAINFIKKIAHIDISYGQWFFAAAPFAIPLLLAVPLLGYLFVRPTVSNNAEVVKWAAKQLEDMGAPSRKEVTLAALVIGAVILWVFAGEYVEASVVAFIVISMMLLLRVVTWDDMARNHSAWTTLVLLATLVAMADGLSRTGFIGWFSGFVAGHLTGLSPNAVLMALVAIYFFAHYFFSSLTAHTTAMMPVLLAVGLGVPGLPPEKLAMGLAMTTGLMGVVSPYATGANLPYYNSGYLTSIEFWRNGTIYGLIYVGALIFIGLPLL